MFKAILRIWQKFATQVISSTQLPLGERDGSQTAQQKILFITDAIDPTFFIYLKNPLKSWIQAGHTSTLTYSRKELESISPDQSSQLIDHIKSYQPTHIIFCRYGGPFIVELLQLSISLQSQSIYLIDDDLFHFPEDMPDVYKARHLTETTLKTRSYGLQNCQTVYCSTPLLEEKLKNKFTFKKSVSDIGCSFPGIGSVKNWQPSKIIGFMGSKSHMRDLTLIQPLIVDFLLTHKDWKFELFGNFPGLTLPQEVNSQIIHTPSIPNYEKFRETLNAKVWAAAFAPLQDDDFNAVKSPIKFIEYTAMGAVSLLSNIGPYTDIVSRQAAISLEGLTTNRLSELLNDEIKMTTYHASALQYCKTRFNPQMIENKLSQLLNK